MKKIMHFNDGAVFSYVEYLPENFDSSKKYPLIVQLHGAGERGDGISDLALVEVHGFSKLFENEACDYECIVVMPQCPKDSFWAARVESIGKFIDEVIALRPIDEKKIYLTGLSMGGYGTWYTAMAYPQKFAAIAPVCGGGMAWNAGVLDMPILVFHGVEDNLVDVRNSDEMVDKLKFLGKNVEYIRLDGVMHNVWDHTYDTALMELFLSKSL